MRVKLIRKHRKDCRAVRSWPHNPWAYFGSSERKKPPLPGSFYADALGRQYKNRAGCIHRWLRIGCNDSHCNAIAAVREQELLELIQKELS